MSSATYGSCRRRPISPHRPAARPLGALASRRHSSERAEGPASLGIRPASLRYNDEGGVAGKGAMRITGSPRRRFESRRFHA